MGNPNTASFPYAAPADLVLTVASNNSQTVINSPVSSGDTTIIVASATSFITPCIIAIDSEFILAVSATSGSFTNCVRGFMGTTAASHTTTTGVFGYILSYHHNQLAAEIKSIGSLLFGSDFGGFKKNENLVTYSENFSNSYWTPSTAVTFSPSSGATL